jgi:hypothetical protein
MDDRERLPPVGEPGIESGDEALDDGAVLGCNPRLVAAPGNQPAAA